MIARRLRHMRTAWDAEPDQPDNDFLSMAVIGHLAEHPERLGQALQTITLGDMQDTRARATLAAMVAQATEGLPTDPVAVADRMMADGWTGYPSPGVYLQRLTADTGYASTVGNFPLHLEALADAGMRRRIHHALQDWMRHIHDQRRSAGELLDSIRAFVAAEEASRNEVSHA